MNDDLTITVPVGATMPIIDALDRAARQLQGYASSQRVTLDGRPVFYVTVRGGVPHLTARQPIAGSLHPECGTDTGYAYHFRKYGTPTCQPCRAAHAAEQRRRKRARLEGLGEA